jgi:sulfur-carrier protein
MTASSILVRYWAAARTAAGVEQDVLPTSAPLPLDEVVRRVVAAHPETRLAGVLEICSVLVGDRPVRTQDPATVEVLPGDTVEFLPPFAGG